LSGNEAHALCYCYALTTASIGPAEIPWTTLRTCYEQCTQFQKEKCRKR
jgi:hypothetical protein